MSEFRAVVLADSDKGGAGHSLHTTFDDIPDVGIAALADPNSDGRDRFARECGADIPFVRIPYSFELRLRNMSWKFQPMQCLALSPLKGEWKV